MSYSRWGGGGSGHWYTYWHTHPKEEEENRDNALFSVCGVAMFKAKDLRDNIDSCLSVVRKKDGCTDKVKLAELKEYMLEFLVDVDRDYPSTPCRRDSLPSRCKGATG